MPQLGRTEMQKKCNVFIVIKSLKYEFKKHKSEYC